MLSNNINVLTGLMVLDCVNRCGLSCQMFFKKKKKKKTGSQIAASHYNVSVLFRMLLYRILATDKSVAIFRLPLSPLVEKRISKGSW
jgi:hypothetical protein